MSGKIAYPILLGSALLPIICASAHGGDITRQQLPAYYYPIRLVGEKKAPDKLSGFKEMQKYASTRSAGFLMKKMGKNYFTGEIAPVVLHALYNAFVPRKSGDIEVKSRMSILDQTANRLIGQEKQRLMKWTGKVSPSLPIIGNMLTDFVQSQNLNLSRGIPHYKTHLKKPVAPEYKLGGYSFSGGVEIRLAGREFYETPIAAFRYGDGDERFSVNVYGKQARFSMDTKHVKADVKWNSRGMKFKVDLVF